MRKVKGLIGQDVISFADGHKLGSVKDVIISEDQKHLMALVLSEGGPTLIGQLAAADVLDELCLSVSPLVVGGDAARVTDIATTTNRHYDLARVLEEDSMLLLRYVRHRA